MAYSEKLIRGIGVSARHLGRRLTFMTRSDMQKISNSPHVLFELLRCINEANQFISDQTLEKE